MAAHCTNCCEALEVSGGRLPPWCPKCGADVGKGTVTPPAPEASVPDYPAAPAAGTAPAADRPAAFSPTRNAVLTPAEDFDETRPLAVHDFSFQGYVQKHGAGFMLAALFLALALGGFALGVARPRAGVAAPALLMAGIGATFLVFSFAGYGKCIRRVEVFADGIRWDGPGGTGRLAWADVEAVYRSEIVLNGFPKSELKLVDRHGGEVAFDLSIARYAELAGHVQGRCAEAMRPRKLKEARACGAEFGRVVVGPSGVSLEGWLVPWESVERYAIARGRLWFACRGAGDKSVPLHAIPNYLLLVYLLGEFAPPAVRQASGLPAAAG